MYLLFTSVDNVLCFSSPQSAQSSSTILKKAAPLSVFGAKKRFMGELKVLSTRPLFLFFQPTFVVPQTPKLASPYSSPLVPCGLLSPFSALPLSHSLTAANLIASPVLLNPFALRFCFPLKPYNWPGFPSLLLSSNTFRGKPVKPRRTRKLWL